MKLKRRFLWKENTQNRLFFQGFFKENVFITWKIDILFYFWEATNTRRRGKYKTLTLVGCFPNIPLEGRSLQEGSFELWEIKVCIFQAIIMISTFGKRERKKKCCSWPKIVTSTLILAFLCSKWRQKRQKILAIPSRNGCQEFEMLRS